MTNQAAAVSALRALLAAILAVVKDTPEGAPGGPMYAALLTKFPDMTSSEFNMLMQTLVETGRLRKSGHVYFYVRDL